ncbi:ABC transporter permease [Rhodoplanes serenus]|uniref:ABC transporter permease n=1 Tax=Rhodoplanes serenus TaxID=200615 RepID=UPI000DABCD39|nr:ABC transporter permease subunit [Rhodoplanes serenus]RAI33369.1 putrescine ABC transporter permease PotH [Rhodoplanes serenus]
MTEESPALPHASPTASPTASPDPSPRRSAGELLIVALPYLWLIAFFVVPFLIVAKISLSQTAIAQPPYTPVLDLAAGLDGLAAFVRELSTSTYALLASDDLYWLSYLKSLRVAVVSTAILLVVGVPIAHAMARAPARLQPLLVMLVMLPFWTAFLIRIYAWMTILQRDGLLNGLLHTLGLIDQPITWLATDTAVHIGIVYSYLPFMVLPLYASFQKLDESLIEAAADLGCPRWKAFWLVMLPQVVPGIAAGSLLCLIPITGEFVIPDLLGGSDTMMIGQTLWSEFFANKDWPVASAIAVVLLVLLVGPIAAYEALQSRAMDGRR